MHSAIKFFTLAARPSDWLAVRLLISSLRRFGGKVNNSGFLLFYAADLEVPLEMKALENVELIPFSATAHRYYYFAQKVTVCAMAEEHTQPDVRVLVWCNPMTLFFNCPDQFLLGGGYSAAFRPVHIQNIGSSYSTGIDPFWQGVYGRVGRQKDSFSVTSYVDQKVLRPYFNSHLFSIDPGMGLMQEWQQVFEEMVGDEDFQKECCSDVLHQVFLHQAILSALLEKRLGIDKLHLLSPDYSYPLHLHNKIPEEKRINTLDKMTCPVYEEEFCYPETLAGVDGSAALTDWLRAVIQD